MRTKSLIFKFISLVTLICFLYACSIHSLREVPKENISNHTGKNVLLIHKDSLVFEIRQPQIINDSLKGSISLYSKPSGKKNYNEFHIYLSTSYEMQIERSEMFSIPISEIAKLEIYKISPGKILGFTLLGVASFYLIVFILIAINGGVGVGLGDMNISFEGNN